jgi:hypothetical protein
MATKLKEKPVESSRNATAKPVESGTTVLDQVRKLLEAGNAEEARKLILRQKSVDLLLNNALGVCLLRLGQVQPALKIFRSLTYSGGGIVMRTDAPLLLKTNLATAMLLSGEVAGCQEILCEIHDDHHPAVQKLRAAVRQWKKSLSLWQWVNWYMGGDVNRPVVLDFPPGDF